MSKLDWFSLFFTGISTVLCLLIPTIPAYSAALNAFSFGLYFSNFVRSLNS